MSAASGSVDALAAQLAQVEIEDLLSLDADVLQHLLRFLPVAALGSAALTNNQLCAMIRPMLAAEKPRVLAERRERWLQQREEMFTEEQVAEYREAFSLFDGTQDGSGTISTREFGTVMRSLSANMTEAALRDYLAELEEHAGLVLELEIEQQQWPLRREGRITFRMLLAIMSRQFRGHDEVLLALFRESDPEDSGLVPRFEVGHVLRRYDELTPSGPTTTDAEIDELLRDFDEIMGVPVSPPAVDYVEFIRFIIERY